MSVDGNRGVAVALAFSVALAGACGAPYEPAQPAPQFILEDKNPASATYGEARAPADVRGKVLLLYFIAYG